MSILNNNELELNTPFAKVIITIAEKDIWAKDMIEEWILHNCGMITSREVANNLKKMEIAREALRRSE